MLARDARWPHFWGMIRSSRGFTLIELLIVIAIIGILMALLFPAVNSAIDAARRAQAKNDVTQLATAITAYETEYGRLPGSTGSSDSNGKVTQSFMDILTATGSGTNDNPRKIVFLEVNTWKKGKSGTNGNNFLDPWGGSYYVALDYNYDNTLSGIGTNGTNVRKKVAAWNKPSDQTNASTSQQSRRYVTSWE